MGEFSASRLMVTLPGVFNRKNLAPEFLVLRTQKQTILMPKHAHIFLWSTTLRATCLLRVILHSASLDSWFNRSFLHVWNWAFHNMDSFRFARSRRILCVYIILERKTLLLIMKKWNIYSNHIIVFKILIFAFWFVYFWKCI